jgi:TolB-like protein/serine/threonine protein kinase/Tfp pilus assembly protein PilF
MPGESVRVCETCGSPIEATSSGDFGCMVCLFDAALAPDPEEREVALASTPDQLGAYTIEHHVDGSLWELGHGAMGVTYRAMDKVLDRPVALKIINSHPGSHTAEMRERFMREARAAAALRHPNVAIVYQFGVREETGQFFYAMELVEGETLEERVRRLGPLDVLTTIDIALQVTAALAAAEECRLVHRDLKPGNLMLVEAAPSPLPSSNDNATRTLHPPRKSATRASHPQVKVIDFGVAKAMAEKTNAMALTHGGFVGTPAFASPEQFVNAAVDVRSDIYSLGATLWFLLTGHILFSGRTIEEIRETRRSTPLPIEQLKAARVPPRLRSLLKSMLAVEPAARPGTRNLAARLQSCAAQATGQQRRRVALAAAAILILAASAFFVSRSLRTHPAGLALNPAAPEKSVAVLPFENLSRDPENAFFADGVQDEILTHLARIADLKVIGRTSVMQYKSRAGRNLRKIGQQLGVANLVEGSVQRSGNRVRVNAQLVDARTNRHLWAQTYDRDLADVFAIESDIAKIIAAELQAKLSPNEESEIARPPTTDITAFDLFTRGNNILLTVDFISNAKAHLLQAADLMNQAVARDPTFLRAYCLLAWAHDYFYFLGFDRTPARLALAEAAIQAALRLRPDAGEAHLARAWHLYLGYLDYNGGLAELDIAHQTLPNDPQIFQLTAYIQRRQGRWEESTRNLQRALDYDPLNTFTLQELAWQYLLLRRYAEVKPLLTRVLAIEPDRSDTKVLLASVDFHWRADTRPLRQMIDSIRAMNPAATPTIAEAWLIGSLAERDADAAKHALIAVGANPINLGGDVYFVRPFVEGVIARIAKDDDKKRSAFTAARAEQEKIIQAQPNFGPGWCVLGLIDAALGRREEALRAGRRAIELAPVEQDAIRGSAMIKYLAMIAAWVGDKDLACEQLATATRYPGSLSYGELKLLPFWDPLRGDPRFEEIVASLAPK